MLSDSGNLSGIELSSQYENRLASLKSRLRECSFGLHLDESERSEIQVSMKETQTHQDREQLDAKIEEHRRLIRENEAAIRVLLRKKEILDQTFNGYQSLLSPIRRMPVDVVREIMIFTCNHNRLTTSIRQGQPTGIDLNTMPAVILSQVCSAWRSLALETQILWSSIAFEVNGDIFGRSRYIDALRSFLEIYMQRSGTKPLSLDVTALLWGWVADDAFKILNPILQQSSRWRQVKLAFDPRLMTDRRLCVIQGKMGMLEKLALIEAPLFGVQAPDPFPYFQVAPRLTSLSTNIWHPREVILPFGQITKLGFEPGAKSPDHYKAWILACPSLTHLTLPSYPYTDGPSDRSHDSYDLTLKDLHTLRLVDHATFTNDLPAFSFLTLPSLQSLEVINSAFSTDRIPDFIMLSGCMITSLSLIEIYGVSDIMLLPTLRLFRALRSLTVHERQTEKVGPYELRKPIITPEFIDHFRIDDASSDSVLLPNLVELELAVNPVTFVNIRDLVFTMAKTRWYYGTTSTQKAREPCRLLRVVRVFAHTEKNIPGQSRFTEWFAGSRSLENV